MHDFLNIPSEKSGHAAGFSKDSRFSSFLEILKMNGQPAEKLPATVVCRTF